MMQQADAIIFTGINQVEVRQVDVPDPASDEVQVRTHVSMISAGTEGWILQNLFTWKTTDYPCIPGYQRVGVIEAVGANVTDWNIGDRVVATRSTWSGGINSQNGAHAALGNTHTSEIYTVPDGVDDVDASGTVVAQVGYNAASRAIIKVGDWVVVYGDGLIGQSAAQAIRARGTKVIVVGHRNERLQLAAEHSADFTINSYETDPIEAIRKHVNSDFVPIILDSVQGETAQTEYMPLIERTIGQIVYCGFTPGKTWADMGLLQRHEVTTHFIAGWSRQRMDATLKNFADGSMSLRPLTTHLVPYNEGPRMYQHHLDKSKTMLGMALDWRQL